MNKMNVRTEFDPMQWGPSFWKVLHTISFNFPLNPTKEEKEQYKNFVVSLGTVIPCARCRKNYMKHLKELKFSSRTLKNKDTFSLFFYNLHNLVNRETRKTHYISYHDVAQMFKKTEEHCKCMLS